MFPVGAGVRARERLLRALEEGPVPLARSVAGGGGADEARAYSWGEAISLNEGVSRLLASGAALERELQQLLPQYSCVCAKIISLILVLLVLLILQLLPRVGNSGARVHALAAEAHVAAFKRACTVLARTAPPAALDAGPALASLALPLDGSGGSIVRVLPVCAETSLVGLI
ncbi:hypothetical protein T492DRAFT_837479 [Pavlovales sp. CCMP2436]|nr:hypothetical protein T492DRAFT_837479 [Pavlovales sp. CCMP2436]